ncbi:hypothetical protein LTR78_001082 [Recurvomyces mirabilis]|uniref:Uncharacterized protein n=1 Tax=Recurvomyces mirabilis TaxID=574656 RepID=A0AAE0WX99_9PEZI|nr:hypothetical protein LTR78_001082 [Recurvomyces mirabilis]KAK5159054.1 hypothetical protein LTS14_003162 [Recurvomyces mirabilis]
MTNRSSMSWSRLRIFDLEKSLGFKWDRTISRARDRQKYPIIKELNAELKRITESYSTLTQTELLHSTKLDKEGNALFDTLGPKLWPADGDVKFVRSQWLAAAAVDDLAGFYPEDLYYETDDHNWRLREAFCVWVVAKCIQYTRNHKTSTVPEDNSTTAKEDHINTTAQNNKSDDQDKRRGSSEEMSSFDYYHNDLDEATGNGDRLSDSDYLPDDPREPHTRQTHRLSQTVSSASKSRGKSSVSGHQRDAHIRSQGLPNNTVNPTDPSAFENVDKASWKAALQAKRTQARQSHGSAKRQKTGADLSRFPSDSSRPSSGPLCEHGDHHAAQSTTAGFTPVNGSGAVAASITSCNQPVNTTDSPQPSTQHGNATAGTVEVSQASIHAGLEQARPDGTSDGVHTSRNTRSEQDFHGKRLGTSTEAAPVVVPKPPFGPRYSPARNSTRQEKASVASVPHGRQDSMPAARSFAGVAEDSDPVIVPTYRSATVESEDSSRIFSPIGDRPVETSQSNAAVSEKPDLSKVEIERSDTAKETDQMTIQPPPPVQNIPPPAQMVAASSNVDLPRVNVPSPSSRSTGQTERGIAISSLVSVPEQPYTIAPTPQDDPLAQIRYERSRSMPPSIDATRAQPQNITSTRPSCESGQAASDSSASQASGSTRPQRQDGIPVSRMGKAAQAHTPGSTSSVQTGDTPPPPPPPSPPPPPPPPPPPSAPDTVQPHMSTGTIFDRAILEIDWASTDEGSSFIELIDCRTAEDMFVEIDDQRPSSLLGATVQRIRIEHANPRPGEPRFNHNIIRARAGPTFRNMLRRLSSLGEDAEPEFKVIVLAWSTVTSGGSAA